MNDLVGHDMANIFPMMDETSLRELATDIKTRGQIDAIILLDGKILDGRNRYAACNIAGVKPRTKEFTGQDALSFVISKNLTRRQLKSGQRAMVAAKIANLREGRPEITASIEAVSQDDAAKQLNVGRASVQRAREVIDHGTDELTDAVANGEVSVSAAAAVSRLPEEEQRAAMNAGPDEVRRVAAEIRVKKSSESSRIYERATKALATWREKYLVIGEDDLRMIFNELFGA